MMAFRGKNRSLVVLTLALAALSLVLAGCSSQDQSLDGASSGAGLQPASGSSEGSASVDVNVDAVDEGLAADDLAKSMESIDLDNW